MYNLTVNIKKLNELFDINQQIDYYTSIYDKTLNELNIKPIFIKKRNYIINKHVITIFYSQTNTKSKTFYCEDNDFFLLLAGNIFNINEFILDDNYNTKNYEFVLNIDKLKSLYFTNNIDFLKNLRGSFNGIILDKNNNILLIFNDPIGSKPLYYFFDNDKNYLCFSNKLSFVANSKHFLGITNELDINTSYQILSFGYPLNNETYIKDVKKFYPGQYFEIKLSEQIDFIKLKEIKRYFVLKSKPEIIGKVQTILDELFQRYCETIKLILSYDELFYKTNDNFKHFIFLSGGLDSRIITGISYKLGYKNLLAVNFAQSFSQDNESAALIAEKLKIDFIFNSLNNGFYILKNIDEIIKANDGLIFFSGASHMFDTISKINLENAGLLINGILIDGFMGGYLDTSKDENWYKNWASSKKLIDKIDNNIKNYIDFFETKEEFNAYNRGINAITNGFRMIEYFGEFASPANDYILSDYSLRLSSSIKYRKKVHEILKYELVIKYLKELRWILYHNNLSPVITNIYISAFFHLMNNIKRILINRPYFSQNPFGKWLKKNPFIINSLDEIYKKDLGYFIENFSNQQELIYDLKALYKNGNLSEKAQVITLLKSIKMHKITK